MQKMYPAVVNSPKTELTELITETQTEIAVMDTSVLLSGEGIATIGNGDAAETILYTSVEGNTLKGCIRGYQGVARSWTVGTRIARNFAAADWDAAVQNIEDLYSKTQDASLSEKGIVQLSNKTDGTSEKIAATEKAVSDARVAAIGVAATDATAKDNAILAKTVSKENGYAPDANSVDPGFHFLTATSLNTPDGDWATLLDVGGAVSGFDFQIAQTWNVERLPYTIRRKKGAAWSSWERLLTQPFNNTWVDLPLLNNWVPYDTSTYRVGVMRYADGLTIIMGTVKSGVGSGILANVGGVALLPKKTVIGNYYSRNNDSTAYASGVLELHANGDIRFGIGQSPQNGALQFTIVYNEREAV